MSCAHTHFTVRPFAHTHIPTQRIYWQYMTYTESGVVVARVGYSSLETVRPEMFGTTPIIRTPFLLVFLGPSQQMLLKYFKLINGCCYRILFNSQFANRRNLSGPEIILNKIQTTIKLITEQWRLLGCYDVWIL
jgi:hypothetical protein